MAGYSPTPLLKKLGIREGARVAWCGMGPPPLSLLGELPEGVTIARSLSGQAERDVIVLFVSSYDELAAQFSDAKARLEPAGGLWVAWPKKASGVKTDLTEDRVRELALSTGLVDNKVCAIDDTWSGLRCVVRLKDRPQAAKRNTPPIPTEKPGASVNHLERLRAMCLAYPEATEVVAWGHPTFRVRDKIFATTGDGSTISVKTSFEQQADLVSSDPRFSIAHYTGKYGWVTMSLEGKVDFGFVESLVAQSYRMIAPKTLSGSEPATKKSATPGKATVKKPTVKKPASTKPTAKKAVAKKTAAKKAVAKPAAKKTAAKKAGTEKPASQATAKKR